MEPARHRERRARGNGSRRPAPGLAGPTRLFALASLFLGMDLVSDLAGGERGLHILGEGVGITLSLAGLALMWRRLAGSPRARDGARPR
jgi:hypothetical protein